MPGGYAWALALVFLRHRINNQSRIAKTAAPTTAPAIAPPGVPDFFVGVSLEAGLLLGAEVDDEDDALLIVAPTVGNPERAPPKVGEDGVEEVLRVTGLEDDDEAGATNAIV